MANYYNFCLYKLFKIKVDIIRLEDYNNLNNKLSSFGLECFQHRLVIRLSSFIYKIFNNKFAPKLLKSLLTRRNLSHKKYDLRSLTNFEIPGIGKFNDRGEETFKYFFSKLINNCFLDEIELNPNLFTARIKNNINLIFIKFVYTFQKFDLNYKKFF